MLDNIIQNFLSIDFDKLRPDNFNDTNFRIRKDDVKRIERGSGWMIVDSCPICGFKQNSIEFNCLGINIVKCLKCTHRYTEKVPVNVDEVYNSEEYHNAVKELELKQKEYRTNLFGKERVDIVKKLFNDTNRTVLDVGSGWGYFLSSLKAAGFNCYGIELSESLAEILKRDYNLNIVSIPIEKYNSDVKFDIITLFGVIEHLKNPVEVLTHCKNLLKDNGYILIFTPNFESVAVRIQNEDANMIYPGLHLHHFTKRSMEKTSELIQMRIYSFCTKGIDIGDMYSYYKYKGKMEIASFLKENADLFQSIIDAIGCANHMRVILQK